MAAVINKRQQARNERALQELIKTVPGNDRCADCQAKNPGWASWSLGIFLCMRCAALHRKLGTHISKVKSLSMDSWSNDQVDNMRQIGNTASNRLFNPQNVKPSIPLDMDEVDSAMERYVRKKYEQRAFSDGNTRAASEQRTGSTGSVEDEPPPLPPKPTKRFGLGLRAASSTFPMSRSDKGPPPRSPAASDFDRRAFAPRLDEVNEVSRVTGATVGPSTNTFESKLGTLRDMGFPDDKRNLQVLKGLNGNLEKAIEALIRLGEGRGFSKVSTLGPAAAAQSNGLFVSKTRATGAAETSAANNPSAQDNPQQQRSATVQPSQPTLTNGVQYPRAVSTKNPYNPFNPPGQPSQMPPPLEQQFQNLHVSQHHELFPNITGPFPLQHQHNPFVETSVPPTHQLPHQPDPYNPQAHLFPQQQVHHPPHQLQQLHANNPFLQSTTPQQSASSNVSVAQYTPSNPYLSSYSQQPFHPQYQQAPQSVPLQPQHPNSQPMTSYFDIQTQSQQQYPQQALPQPARYIHHQPTRHDKASILALYNYPHLAPVRPTASPLEQSPSENSALQGQPSVKQRSVTAPVGPIAGSMNPFMPSSTASSTMTTMTIPAPADTLFAETNGAMRHASQDSVDFKGLQNGRHSPDAFASLSARYVR